MRSILITGSNRGIGLALVRTYLSKPNVRLFATCRHPEHAHDLQALAQAHPNLTILPLNVMDETAIAEAVNAVSAHVDGLDLLINNAGIYPEEAESRVFGQLQGHAVAHVLNANAVSALLVTQGFVELLKRGNQPCVAMVSSQMGSLTRTGSASGIAYRMSKAAMNMAAKGLAGHLRSAGICVITTHPGHVATDMGGQGAPVTPTESAEGLVRLFEHVTLAESGSFFDYTGAIFPW